MKKILSLVMLYTLSIASVFAECPKDKNQISNISQIKTIQGGYLISFTYGGRSS